MASKVATVFSRGEARDYLDLAGINGATSNGTTNTGCTQTPTTVTVGSNPYAAAVDPATDTVYVSNNANSDAPGSVSVIDGASCNGTTQTG